MVIPYSVVTAVTLLAVKLSSNLDLKYLSQC